MSRRRRRRHRQAVLALGGRAGERARGESLVVAPGVLLLMLVMVRVQLPQVETRVLAQRPLLLPGR